ncbi:methylenetetrahydrofolate reductase C-terminal domain-containing protein [Planctomycetota bacterium]
MHATIQKPMDEILSFLRPGEKVYVFGCSNCAMKCRSGGPEETERMVERLRQKGVKVTGSVAPAEGSGLCKLSLAQKLVKEHQSEINAADSFVVLACGQGFHTIVDATEGGLVHPGCDTIFGGETERDDLITEYCSLCGECLTDLTGGLCPLTLCAKGLLNGPCGGAKDRKCEADPNRECGWILIYERLKSLGRLENLEPYQEPKNNAKWSRLRSLDVGPTVATFHSLAGEHTVSQDD